MASEHIHHGRAWIGNACRLGIAQELLKRVARGAMGLEVIPGHRLNKCVITVDLNV